MGSSVRAVGSVASTDYKRWSFMEPRGCSWSQPVANRIGAEMARTSENVCRGLQPLAIAANSRRRPLVANRVLLGACHHTFTYGPNEDMLIEAAPTVNLRAPCSHGGQQRMEPLWNVMKKGLLAGDTLR